MQTDEHYVKLKDELQFAETSVLEVEQKMQMLNNEVAKVIEQVNQVLYMKTQIKQGNPVEYMMPNGVMDSMSKLQRGVSDTYD
jgi:isopropylmalate/homocitrate/citramalate synthase